MNVGAREREREKEEYGNGGGVVRHSFLLKALVRAWSVIKIIPNNSIMD
jgi:hypothetical protein